MAVPPATGAAMICPHCHKDGSTVARELPMGLMVFRMRVGSCGHSWTTWESELICNLNLGQIVSNAGQTGSNGVISGSKKGGDLGGVDSGIGSESGSSGSDPDPSKLSDQLNLVSARESNATQQEQAKTQGRRVRSGSKDYPVEFEVIWSNTGKRGTKLKALRAWEKQGKPTWDAISSTWSAYLGSYGPSIGGIQHLSTWFNGEGHTQEWPPAKLLPANGIHEQRAAASRAAIARSIANAPRE